MTNKRKDVVDDGSSDAKRKKVADDASSSNGKKKKGKANELGIILKKSAERERFDKLAGRGIAVNRYPYKTTLNALSIRENVRILVGNIGWERCLGHAYSTYTYLTLEFLSTLCFTKDKYNVDDPQHNVI
jgi:hypothetical protein